MQTYLDLKCKVFLHVLDNHDQIGKFDAQGLPRIGRTGDISRADVGSHNFQNKTLNVRIGDSFNMTISNFLVPDLQRLGANAVQDGQEAGLKRVLEHTVKVKPFKTTRRTWTWSCFGLRSRSSCCFGLFEV